MTDMHMRPQPSYIPLYALLALGLVAIALLVSSTRAEKPFHLDRVVAHRYTDVGDNKIQEQSGVLHVGGSTQWQRSRVIDQPDNVQLWTLGPTLIKKGHHAAYHLLGFSSLQNFDFMEYGGVNVYFGAESFLNVRAAENNVPYRGKLANMSTRVRTRSGDESAIVGFVVTEHPHIILIRAIGPDLLPFNVTDALADTRLVVHQGDVAIHVNDNWSSSPTTEVGLVKQVASHVGAFPIETDSKDSAALLTLEPGAYTVHVQSTDQDTAGGSILIGAYMVPVDFILSGS